MEGKVTTKFCNKCSSEKELHLFANSKSGKHGKSSICKACQAAWVKKDREENPEKYKERRKEWTKNNPEYVAQWKKRNAKRTKDIKRREYLKSKYGITIDQYNEMRRSQECKCYICGKHETEIPNAGETALNIDHCHSTGKIRKLICMSCNIALGKLNDDVSLFIKCANYIKEHSENETFHSDSLQRS